MSGPKVLLVEDSAKWQELLRMHIELSCPDAEITVAATFQEADAALRRGGWALLVTDIGLPPDIAHVYGMELVRAARITGVPCVVVSETKAVSKQHAVDLVTADDYRALGFFSKVELTRDPDRRRRFDELVRATVASRSARAGARRRVVIAGGTEGDPRLLLRTDGLPDLEIPSGSPCAVFYFFVLNVLEAKPAAVVGYAALNPVFESSSREKAAEALRGTLHDLNARVREWLGLSDTESCFVNARSKGYHLNTDALEWDVDPALRAAPPPVRSVRATATDPRTVQENTRAADSTAD